MNETKLAWLAGIIDGEGSIGARISSGRALTLQLKITNTNMIMINEIKCILESIGITYSISKPYMANRATVPSVCIEVARKTQLLNLCNILHPYIISKKEELELAITYLIKSTKYKIYATTDEDLAIRLKFIEIHHKSGRKGNGTLKHYDPLYKPTTKITMWRKSEQLLSKGNMSITNMAKILNCNKHTLSDALRYHTELFIKLDKEHWGLISLNNSLIKSREGELFSSLPLG